MTRYGCGHGEPGEEVPWPCKDCKNLPEWRAWRAKSNSDALRGAGITLAALAVIILVLVFVQHLG
jgi:hypothetical protein